MFRFRLAAQLGCTVAELGRRLTVAELTEWMAYANIEPFGDGFAAFQRAEQMALNANLHAPRKNDPYRPQEFMPDQFRPDPKPQSPAQMRMAAYMIFGAPDRIGKPCPEGK